MSQFINTNMASLNAQRNLMKSQGSLATSLQRLSSGLRINSAKDDAAGLAISERFTTQIRGLNQAIRNANDGISLAQTGEGALNELMANLQRIRELAVQSTNATNSDSDRLALNQEVQQRLAEIDRIAEQTSFNSRNFLDGSFGNAAFQVGANVGQTISIGLGTETSMRQSAIGAVATAQSVDLTTLITEDQDAVPTTSPSSGAFTDATLLVGNTFTLTVDGVAVFTRVATGLEAISAANLDGDDSGGTGGLGNATVQANLAAVGITFTGNFTDGIVFSKADGTDFTITASTTGAGGTFSGAGFVGAQTNGTEASTGSPLVLADGDLTIQIGSGDAVAVAAGTYATQEALLAAVNNALGSNATASITNNVLSFTSGDTITVGGTEATNIFTSAENLAQGNLTTVDVNNVANANTAILRIDSALTSVSELRSTFGAIQNRFESAIASLSTTVENLSTSRSRIQDTDFAAETANLTRNQILQQAGIAMLAQANALPQNVLSLLR